MKEASQKLYDFIYTKTILTEMDPLLSVQDVGRCGEREGAGGRDYKRAWENFDDYRYVHYLDFGDDFIGVYTRQNLSVMRFKYMPFTVFQLCLNKAVKNILDIQSSTWQL